MADAATAWSLVLVIAALANIFFTWSLVQTWTLLRQVKFYLVMLAVGHWVEVCFTLTPNLAWAVTGSFQSTTATCRFVAMMSTLGESLSAMAVAALALHLLLTAITGSQGSALRHGLGIGLFSSLSLVMPFTVIPFYRAVSLGIGSLRVCALMPDSPWQYAALYLASSITLVFFPILFFLLCWAVAAALFFWTRTRTVKADEESSDYVIVGLIGTILLCFSLPYYVYLLTTTFTGDFSDTTYYVVNFLLHMRNVATALACATFAFVYARRHQSSAYGSLAPPPAHSGSLSEERQKLVN